MAKTIDTTVGIYNTEYTLIKHRDGSISVKEPFVKWTNNTGTLSFRTVKIEKFIDQALACFEDEDNAEMSLSEILYVHEIA